MTNIVLRQLREAGLLTGDVLPFAYPDTAAALATRLGRCLMVVATINNGDYWVVTAEDAARLIGAGYSQHGKPEHIPIVRADGCAPLARRPQ